MMGSRPSRPEGLDAKMWGDLPLFPPIYSNLCQYLPLLTIDAYIELA